MQLYDISAFLYLILIFCLQNTAKKITFERDPCKTEEDVLTVTLFNQRGGFDFNLNFGQISNEVVQRKPDEKRSWSDILNLEEFCSSKCGGDQYDDTYVDNSGDQYDDTYVDNSGDQYDGTYAYDNSGDQYDDTYAYNNVNVDRSDLNNSGIPQISMINYLFTR